MQQEPDASSFPNGGIRNTFEARGYSVWDISSRYTGFRQQGSTPAPTQDRTARASPPGRNSAPPQRRPCRRCSARAVADGMRRWAIDNGARHYTHWFHPLTDGTAEKHDSFVEHNGKGGVVEEFSGKLLMQQEPDASSFPQTSSAC